MTELANTEALDDSTDSGAEPGNDVSEEIGANTRTPMQKFFSFGWSYTLLVLLAEVAFFAIFSGSKFLTSDNLILTAQNVAVLTVMASGATFVLITAGVDLSIGSTAILAEVLTAKTITGLSDAGQPVPLWVILVGVLVGVLAGILVGVVNGVGVAYLRVPPLIMTLGTLTGALSAAQILTNGVNQTTRAMSGLGTGRVLGVPYIVLVALAVVVAMGITLHLTTFGRHTYAVGSNEEAASRVGINVQRHLTKVYGLAGAMSGLGGVLSLARFSTSSIGGHSLDPLQAIAAAALGGTSVFGGAGTILGTVIGVWIPGVLQNGIIILGVQAYWQGIIIGAVLVGTVWFDQHRRRKSSGK